MGAQAADEVGVRENMTTGDRQKVTLDEEVPVDTVYLPVWADDEGHVHFTQDVYDEIDEA